jgi:glycerophosphoryl diester phosphodiesterase
VPSCRALAAFTVTLQASLACTRATTGRDPSLEIEDRPRHLVAAMRDGPLKRRLEQCEGRPMHPTLFSIGHRGAALAYPEHTRESYEAAARMGAGIIECDVTFTRDLQLVCRHSQCDLHNTTNILATPLAAKCSAPFSPADPAHGKDATARCCTSDLTLAEFETLCGKMEGFDPKAPTVSEYLKGGAGAPDGATACGKVMSHAESIALIGGLGRSFVPELKAPSVSMPFAGKYDFDDYAAQLIDDYERAGIPPERVFPQSASLRDISYWISHTPRYARNAVYLDEQVDEPSGYDRAVAALAALRAAGVHIVAPPLWALLTLDAGGRIVPSSYAVTAKQVGLELLTWTLERSGSLAGGGGYYYRSVRPAITNEGDTYVVLDVLAREVGIRGIFSDWPATVTYYADCMGL